jgi:LysR family transcriptional activator of glutamate synthase operon
MELRQIKYFIEVAKKEHVTHAADSLHVAQSAVSRQIANLETELGTKLLMREGRNIKLTPVGKIFLEHVEIGLAEIENATNKIKEFLNPEAGVIRIGFLNSLAANTLPIVISSFREKYPNISFQVQQGSMKYLLRSVARGGIDLAFVAPVPRNEETITGRIFFTEKMVALLPEDHVLAETPSIRLDELRDDPFVLFRTGLRQNIVLQACQQAGFHPQIAFEGEDIDTIKGLVAAGLGVGLLPETTLSDSVPRETVKVAIHEPNVTRTVGVVTPKSRDLAPSEKLFYDFLRDFYEVLNRFGQ